MCGIFGFNDYKHKQSETFINSLCNSLARESETRGNHATGVACVNKGAIAIYKEPNPASKLEFRLPKHTSAVMGHTRHATQGSEKDNCNNHPFAGHVRSNYFAFAHNGVIYNDLRLRRELKLPDTKIETDSYIGVQLLESQNELSLNSHKYMAEQIQGSFTFSTLDTYNNLYITKGSSPVSIIHFKEIGLYIYASTEMILWRAILNTSLFNYIKKVLAGSKQKAIEFIELQDGEIIKIASTGTTSKCKFKVQEFAFDFNWWDFRYPYSRRFHNDFEPKYSHSKNCLDLDPDYLSEIIQTATSMGINEDDIILLNEMGFALSEIEELIYSPEILRQYLAEAYSGFEIDDEDELENLITKLP